MTVLDTSGKLVSVTALLVGLGAGVAIGYSMSFPNDPIDRTIELMRGGADPVTRLEASIAVLSRDIAAMNERVARLPQRMNQNMPAESQAPSSGTIENKEEPVRTEANFFAQATANAVLDNAIGVGRWTASDRDRLREHFGALATADKLALLHKLAEAVNSEQLSVRDLQGPPIF